MRRSAAFTPLQRASGQWQNNCPVDLRTLKRRERRAPPQFGKFVRAGSETGVPIMLTLPKMFRVRQKLPASPTLIIPATVEKEFQKLRPLLKPGARIAVGVGSRGIANIDSIVAALITQLKTAGTQPFI